MSISQSARPRSVAVTSSSLLSKSSSCAQYNGSKWRGGVLKVQPATEDYASKLVAEWAQQKEAAAAFEAAQRVKPEVVGPSDLEEQPLVLLTPDGQVGCHLNLLQQPKS